MNRFETLIFPIILLVAIGSMFLTRLGPDSAILVARTVGITLVVILVAGFIARTVVKFKRAKARQAELDKMMSELQPAAGEVDPRIATPEESHEPRS